MSTIKFGSKNYRTGKGKGDRRKGRRKGQRLEVRGQRLDQKAHWNTARNRFKSGWIYGTKCYREWEIII